MPRRVRFAVLASALAVAACSGSASATRPAPTTAASSAAPASAAPSATSATPSSARSKIAAPSDACGYGGTPAYRHVIWIWMENRAYDTILGNGGSAPHLQQYADACGVATNYDAVTHPSLPNYIAATSGGQHGVTTDCSPRDCPVGSASLYQQVAASGRHWQGFAESMNGHCERVDHGRYAARHNPAVYYTKISGQCSNHDVPLGGTDGKFAKQLANNRLAAFTFVTPNLCSDGHDCATTTADEWLGRWLDRITGSAAYGAGRTVVFVTWDEDDRSTVENRVATEVIGPTVPGGTRSGTHFTHYSLLRTTESLLGLPYLGKAKDAANMRGDFGL